MTRTQIMRMHAHVYKYFIMQLELITLHVWRIEDRILVTITFYSLYKLLYVFLLLGN